MKGRCETRVVAVVVTYNRLELLKECIDKIKSQSIKVDLIIVDNHSDDGTGLYLKELASRETSININAVSLEKNVGGAGGFNYGMRLAVENGYELIWIMDDDTMPAADACEKLLKADKDLGGDYGFLSSTVYWVDGNLCRMNIQHKIGDQSGNLTKVDSATFVSLLFREETIKKFGLPIKDFFIWGDDKEYTMRLSQNKSCYWVKDSSVVHKMKNNSGSSISKDALTRVPRYYYAYRNDYWTCHRHGTKKVILFYLAFALNIFRVFLFSKDGKRNRMKIMIEGLQAGKKFNPEIEYI